jgi:hypothetical protein
MIAKIEPAFSSMATLDRKIEYQLEKISSGEAKELFNSTGDSLSSFSDYMFLFSSLNDRVKLPYSEITLNLSPGERLSEENWIKLSKEYMEKMGYGECCYSVILNLDKEHSHVHILHSRIDSDGKSVSNSLDYKRSEKLSRDLEKKYGLVCLTENERTKERLSAISGQRYYFDNALKRAIKNYAVKERLMSILSSAGVTDLLGDRFLKEKLDNGEWMSLLGSRDYDTVLSILKKGGFLKTLYKEELLAKLDKAYSVSNSFQDFRHHLQKEGVYMRLTSKKDKSYYVYGLSEDSFYIKDSSLPKKFRYGNMYFDTRSMSYDEQKHYLYNRLNLALDNSGSYESFKRLLSDFGIGVKEHVNAKGIYGLSYFLMDVETAFDFKASDISRKFTYANIQNRFSNEPSQHDNTIHRVGEWRENIERDNAYMSHSSIPFVPDVDITGGNKKNREDDLPVVRRKKKQKNNDLSL